MFYIHVPRIFFHKKKVTQDNKITHTFFIDLLKTKDFNFNFLFKIYLLVRAAEPPYMFVYMQIDVIRSWQFIPHVLVLLWIISLEAKQNSFILSSVVEYIKYVEYLFSFLLQRAQRIFILIVETLYIIVVAIL